MSSPSDLEVLMAKQGSAPPIVAPPPPDPALPPVPQSDPFEAYRKPGLTFDVTTAKGERARATIDQLTNEPDRFASHDIDVISPDGQSGTVPFTHVQQALAEGYKLESSTESYGRRAAEATPGLTGAVKAAVMSGTNELFLGVPDVVYRHTQDDFQNAADERLKKEHAFASALGSVIGFGGSLLTGAPVFKAAGLAGGAAARVVERGLAEGLSGRLLGLGVREGADTAGKALARTMIAGAAKLGTEAGAIAAPKAITEAAFDDKQAAAETLLYSIGGGAALGAVGAGAAELFKRLPVRDAIQGAADAVGSATAKASAEAGFKSLDPTQQFSKKVIQQYGLDGIEGVGARLKELGLARDVGEDASGVLERIEAKHQDLGSQIRGLYTGLDAKLADEGGHSGLKANDIARRLRKEVVAGYESDVGRESVVKKLEGYIDSFAAKRGTSKLGPQAELLAEREGGKKAGWMTFEDLHNVRTLLDEDIYGMADDVKMTPTKGALEKFRHVITNELETKGADASKLVGESNWLHRLKRTNEDFGITMLARDTAQRSAVGEATNRMLSPSDYYSGGVGASAGHAIGAIVGGAPGAFVGGAAGGIGASALNRYLRKNWHPIIAKYGDQGGPLVIEQALRRAAQKLDEIPDALNRMGASKASTTTIPAHAIARILGGNTSDRRDRVAQYQALADKLAAFHADPVRASDDVGQLSNVFRDHGAPETADEYSQAQLRALSHMQQSMPQAPVASGIFSAKPAFTPTREQLIALEHRAEVFHDPFVVLPHLERGTLSAAHVDALQAMYPKIHGAIVSRIAAHAADPKAPKLSETKRQRLAMLMGIPIGGDAHTAGGARFQASYAGDKAPKPLGSGGGIHTSAKVSAPGVSDVQRLAG